MVADQGLQRSGLHWRWAVAAAVLVLVLGWKGLQAAPGTISHFLAPKAEKATGARAVKPSAGPVAPSGAVVPATPRPVVAPVRPMLPPQPAVGIRWYSRQGQSLVFGLTDGTVLRNPPGAVWTGRELMFTDGRRYSYKEAF